MTIAPVATAVAAALLVHATLPAADAPSGVPVRAAAAGIVSRGTPYAAPASHADPWFGPDKFQHVAVSYAAATAGFALASLAGTSRDASLGTGILLSAAAGVGKEVADRRAGRAFSVRDLVADAAGTVAAFLVLREVR